MYKVLVVDDEAVEREGVSYLLKANDFPLEIITANNGREAYQMISETDKAPVDILITDIKMPFLDGLELIAKIREENYRVDIIVMSAYGEFEYTSQAIQHKVDDYLLKPIIVEEFVLVIKRAVGRLDAAMKKMEKNKELVGKFQASPHVQKQEIFERVLFLKDDSLDPMSIEPLNKSIVDKVIDLIEENYKQDISLEWLAEELYLSPGYLSGLFKKETGRSVFQYITPFRMEKARDLLINTNKKIVDICAEVGYKSPSHFGMQFKKIYGISPNAVRSGNEDSPDENSEIL